MATNSTFYVMEKQFWYLWINFCIWLRRYIRNAYTTTDAATILPSHVKRRWNLEKRNMMSQMNVAIAGLGVVGAKTAQLLLQTDMHLFRTGSGL